MEKNANLINKLINVALFIIRNFFKFLQIKPLPCENLQSDLIIRPCLRGEVDAVFQARLQIDGERFALPIRLLIKLLPAKTCFVVVNSSRQIVALTVYYFNERDILENTIHEGFIGVIGVNRGRGIANMIRRYIKESFVKERSLTGISSRITLDNVASVKTGETLGYRLIETYNDPISGKKRGYFTSLFIREN